MKVLRSSRLAGFSCLVLAALVSTANADVPAKHPYYLHALTDLRTAHWLIEHQPGDLAVSAQEHVAATAIDAALADIKRASIDDGKDTDDHVPVDAPNEVPGHLREALELLRHAHDDIGREKDDSGTRGLRNRAIRHVDAAIHATERAVSDTDHHP
jgi:hypothetical protein